MVLQVVDDADPRVAPEGVVVGMGHGGDQPVLVLGDQLERRRAAPDGPSLRVVVDLPRELDEGATAVGAW